MKVKCKRLKQRKTGISFQMRECIGEDFMGKFQMACSSKNSKVKKFQRCTENNESFNLARAKSIESSDLVKVSRFHSMEGREC